MRRESTKTCKNGKKKNVIEITEFLDIIHFWYSKECDVSESEFISVLR
jgi:hypothetical protein